jgi:threonine dehydrogenase-like Zn-dependent dehydrogenase
VQTAESRAFWIIGPGRGEIRVQPPLAPSAGDVVVRTLYSAVSRGTESLVYRGLVPPSEYQRMRAPFQEGDFPGPVKYGYASVGEVESGPAELVGKRVFSLYPHQTRYAVPASAAHVLPAHVPPGRAILAANLETAVNATWDVPPRTGDRIAIVGGGVIGCLLAWLIGRTAGCRVQVVDTDAGREGEAATLGASFAHPDNAARDCDIVFHASGTPEGLTTALKLAGFEAAVVELSWYGTRSVALPLGEDFHSRRLRLISSQVGAVPASRSARWDRRRRLQLALELLGDHVQDSLISGESTFDELPDVMPRLVAGRSLCHRIRYV